MDAHEQVNQYKHDSVNTASPEQLALMLYRAALAGVEEFQAKIAQEPERGLDLSKSARDILAALADNVNLGHAHGQQMRDLYLFCWRTLLRASTDATTEGVDSVQAILRNLIAGLEGYQRANRVKPLKADEPLSINFAG